jgi:hypothetical protein
MIFMRSLRPTDQLVDDVITRLSWQCHGHLCQKVQIIVEHFHANVAYLLEGKAKAMVVTDLRKAAVKYKKAIARARLASMRRWR